MLQTRKLKEFMFEQQLFIPKSSPLHNGSQGNLSVLTLVTDLILFLVFD